MRKWMGSGLAALAIALTVPGDAMAQEWGPWRFDLGIKGGYAYFTDMLDDAALGEGTENVRLKAGWLAGAEGTFWFTDRIGLRGDFDYTDRPIVMSDDADTELVNDVNVWHALGDLMFRLGNPDGARFTPYIALGAGATWLNPPGSDISDDEGTGTVFAVPNDPVAGRAFILEDDASLTWHAALGGDLRLARNFGLRLEVGDRMFDPQLFEATGFPLATVRSTNDNDVGNWVHEIYGTVGLQMLMGVREREEVAVAPAPPPPPPAAPAPPAEEAVSVCVVDPNAPGGLSMVNAYYLPATGDTMVDVNGQRQRLTRTSGVTLASEADWYVRGEPLTFNAGTQRYEYVTYGTSRLINASDLVYVGTVRGVPVYANAADVSDIRADLDAMRASGQPFETQLAQNTAVKNKLDTIQVLYVPLQPTGCIFQGLQRVQEVRKSRGK